MPTSRAPAVPRLRKSLGQHHLRHGDLCRPLVSWLAPTGLAVVEIGPGGGILTRELLEAGARVMAWEVDPAWAFRLGSAAPSAHLVVGDALQVPWERLPAGSLVAGNLPYNIATPLIEALLLRARGVERAGFLVQAEVAARLLAAPGSRDYGLLTVMVAAQAEVVALGRVAAASFRPPPKVDGAFVGLRRREPAVEAGEMASFHATVVAAFSQRRKMLRNPLAAAWGRREAERVLERAEIDGRRRAETLSLVELVAMHRARSAGSERSKP